MWPSQSRGSLSPTGLCWSSGSLSASEPDEPRWTWTQTWIQAQMPYYNLNWSKRSSATQCLSMTSSPTWSGPAEAGNHSILNLSSTLSCGAKLKSGHPVDLFVTASPQTGLETRSMTQSRFIVGVKGGGGARAETCDCLYIREGDRHIGFSGKYFLL